MQKYTIDPMGSRCIFLHYELQRCLRALHIIKGISSMCAFTLWTALRCWDLSKLGEEQRTTAAVLLVSSSNYTAPLCSSSQSLVPAHPPGPPPFFFFIFPRVTCCFPAVLLKLI